MRPVSRFPLVTTLVDAGAEVTEKAELRAEELGEEVGDLIVRARLGRERETEPFALMVAFVQC